MNIRIVEIFRSIQGEGKYIGFPTVFVRFAGCDVQCQWCDTDHVMREEVEVEEVFRRVKNFYEKGDHVSLTGGEPLLQPQAVRELAELLKMEGIPVYLETNGVRYKEFEAVRNYVDIVAMDFKLPSSTGCRAFWAEHREMLSLAKDKDLFVKVVVTPVTTRDDVAFAVKMIASVNHSIPFYLQPETSQLKNGALEQCFKFQEYALEFLRDVRVVPQVHRLLGIQ